MSFPKEHRDNVRGGCSSRRGNLMLQVKITTRYASGMRAAGKVQERPRNTCAVRQRGVTY
jgi:hypothetical protein